MTSVSEEERARDVKFLGSIWKALTVMQSSTIALVVQSRDIEKELLKLSPIPAKGIALVTATSAISIDMIYAVSQVILIPSLSEDIPMEIYEAMARGKVVVTPDVGGRGEVMVDGTGFALSSRKLEKLAGLIRNCIGSLLSSSELLVTTGTAAREHVVSHYPVDNLPKLFLDQLCKAQKQAASYPIARTATVENVISANVELSRRHNLQQLAESYEKSLIDDDHDAAPFSVQQVDVSGMPDVHWPAIHTDLISYSIDLSNPDTALITFVWMVTRKMDSDYMVFVHLLDEEVRFTIPIIRQY